MPKLSTKDKPPDRATTMRVSARQNPVAGGKVQSVPGRSAVKAPKSAPSLKGGAKTPKSAPSLKSGMKTPTESVISAAPSAISGNMEKSRQFSTAGSKSGMTSMRSQSMRSRIGSKSRRGTGRGGSSRAGPGGVVIVQSAPPPEDDRRRICGIPMGIFVGVVIAAIVLLLIIIVVVVVVVVVKGKESEDKIVVNMNNEQQKQRKEKEDGDVPEPDDTTTTTPKVLTTTQDLTQLCKTNNGTWYTSTVTQQQYCYNNKLKQNYADMDAWCAAQGLAMISFGGLNDLTRAKLEVDFLGKKLAELQTIGSWTDGYLLEYKRSGPQGIGVRSDYKDKKGRTLVDDLWGPSEPNHNWNCIVMYLSGGKWIGFDHDCFSKYPTVCWLADLAMV